MVNSIEVIENEDSSVNDLINKTAMELHKKYNKQRKINEKLLNKKTPAKRALSIFLDVLCVVMLIIGAVVCFSILNTTINGYMPNFAGYTNMIVSSRSMEKSGFNVGDVVIIHSVDARTLNVGDKIAFYVEPFSDDNFDVSKAVLIDKEETKHKYTLTFSQLFGFQSDEIKTAARKDRDVVFHHISAIYRDEGGAIWFKTKGSSNPNEDDWFVKDCYVTGVQDETWVAKSVLNLVKLASKPHGIIILSIPVIVLLVVLALSFLKNIQIAKLELDCVEEKRKITDPICVKNNVGYQMSNKTKYKILAQATDENIDEYLKLLWKDGAAPGSVKKYYLRKKVLLNTNKQLLELNRKCEKMFKKGDKPTKIAKFYLEERAKIEERNEKNRNKLKDLERKKKQDNKNGRSKQSYDKKSKNDKKSEPKKHSYNSMVNNSVAKEDLNNNEQVTSTKKSPKSNKSKSSSMSKTTVSKTKSVKKKN